LSPARTLTEPLREGGTVKRPASHLLMFILVAGVLLLALALTFHQVGMDPSGDMNIVGACIAVLAAALLLVVPKETTLRSLIALGYHQRLVPAPILLERPRCRPPPSEEGTVLLC
jgi:hypothetical protein